MNGYPICNPITQVTMSVGDKVFIKQMRLGDNWQPEPIEAEGVITGFDKSSFTVLYGGQYRVFPFQVIGDTVRVVYDPQLGAATKAKRGEIQALYDFFEKHGMRYCKDTSDIAKIGKILFDLRDALFWIDKLSQEQGGDEA